MSLYDDENKIKSIQMAGFSFIPSSSFSFDKTQSVLTNQNQKSLIRRKNFSPEEDKLLTDLVSKFGSKKWSIIAQYFKYRTARQCRERYNNYLAPTVFKGQWLKEEDDLLYEKYKEIGPKWSKMKVFFNNRSPNLLKNRWKYFVSKNYPQITSSEQEQTDDDENQDNTQSVKTESSPETDNTNSIQTLDISEKENNQNDYKILYDYHLNQQNLFMSLTDFEEIYSFPILSQVSIPINDSKMDEFSRFSFDVSLI